MIRRSKMWASGLAAAMVLALSAAALPQFFTTGDAEAFTPPANSGYIAIDCDTVTAGIQDACTFPSGTTTVTVNVVIGNNLGFDTDIGAFNFEAIATPQTMLNPPVGTDADKNANPNFLEATVGAAGTWSCSPPAPSNDKDPSASVANSFLSCFESTGTTTALADGTFLPVASITYNTTNGADGLIRIQSVSVGDSFGTPYVDCGLLSDTDPCFDATIAIGSAATNTPTATNTTAPATNTPTATNTTAPATNTPTATNTTAPATNTPTATNTSEVPVATDTPTNTATNTPTATNTSEVPVATDTPTNTPTNTPTATNTSEVPATNTPTATNTSEVPATNTPTATNTSEAPATNTPSPTNTSSVPTNTPTATNTAVPTNTPTATATPGAGECMTIGEKVSAAVNIVIRFGAEEGQTRYRARFDLNGDGVIDGDDMAIVLDAPTCVRGKSGSNR